MDPQARILHTSLHQVSATLVGTTTLLAPSGVAANPSQVVVSDELLALDPGGAARVVNLPPVTGLRGARLMVVNVADAAEDLYLVDDVLSATLVTVSQSETGIVVAGDTRWYNAGLAKAT